MFIKRLKLQNFRNYKVADVEFQSGVNLIWGSNGQGKTNLVEAINLFSHLSSHRVAGHTPLIREGQDSALLSVEISHEDKEILLELELNRDSTNRARLNKSNLSRVKEVLGYLSAVIFSPEDLDIVKRDPSNRRDFIDKLVVQVNPRYLGVYSDFDRVLKQRNSLLKSARSSFSKTDSLSTLDAWDESLVEYGSDIISARMKLIEKLRPFLISAYEAIADQNNHPRIFVKASVVGSAIFNGEDAEDSEFLNTSDKKEIADLFRSKLSRARKKEIERGITLVGPHRDDLVLMLGTLPTKGYASHGECWSYSLALRLASLELLRQESRYGDPILILDDVFAELDVNRRKKLANLVLGNEQVIITAAVIEDVPIELISNKIHVVGGEASYDRG
jgi:DNA replication and repair protein RecF